MGKAMVPFFSSGTGDYTAFVGADLEAKPGVVTVTVKGTTTTGLQRDSQMTLLIKPKPFKKGIVFGWRRIRPVEPGSTGKDSEGPRRIFPRVHDFRARPSVGRALFCFPFPAKLARLLAIVA